MSKLKLWTALMGIALYGFFFVALMLTSGAAWLCCAAITWWRIAGFVAQFVVGLGGLVAGGIYLVTMMKP